MSTKTPSPFSRLRIVLVEPSHTGNMGSVARAMKTMGLSQLVMVNPILKPDSQSYALASGAADVLDTAQFYGTLDAALAPCTLVIGASVRSRALSWPALTPESSAHTLVEAAMHTEVALVFGRERFGLTNDELQRCHYHVTIPANPEYSSLNLAMSVQILTYEIRKAMLDRHEKSVPVDLTKRTAYPLSEDLERFYIHLEQTLRETGFIHPTHPGQVMAKLRRLYNRARPETQELNILRGMLTAINRIKVSE